jgi:hypothetical protein
MPAPGVAADALPAKNVVDATRARHRAVKRKQFVFRAPLTFLLRVARAVWLLIRPRFIESFFILSLLLFMRLVRW